MEDRVVFREVSGVVAVLAAFVLVSFYCTSVIATECSIYGWASDPSVEFLFRAVPKAG